MKLIELIFSTVICVSPFYFISCLLLDGVSRSWFHGLVFNTSPFLLTGSGSGWLFWFFFLLCAFCFVLQVNLNFKFQAAATSNILNKSF
jgi:hypothetical protein